MKEGVPLNNLNMINGTPSTHQLNKHQWTVRTCEMTEAATLCANHHYARGCANTAIYRHGLYQAEDFFAPITGAALWMPPTKVAAQSVHHDWQGVLCLSRLVVAPNAPPNAASYLLGRSIRIIKTDRRFHTLLTYADTAQGHTGAIYRATNWDYAGQTKGDPIWKTTEGKQVSRKSASWSRSISEMRSLGYIQHKAAPKHKFVKHLWHPRTAND